MKLYASGHAYMYNVFVLNDNELRVASLVYVWVLHKLADSGMLTIFIGVCSWPPARVGHGCSKATAQHNYIVCCLGDRHTY